MLGKPFRRFDKLNLRKWLLTRFKINKMPHVHIVERYMDAAKNLGIANDREGLDFFVPDDQQVPKQELPEDFQDGFIGFVIGGTYTTKKLPTEKIIEIINEMGQPVALLGGPEDKATGEEVVREASGKVWNTCGRFSLLQSASLVQQAKVVIAHDTGLMHIAAAFKKPVASIWGNTVPEFGMYPCLPEDKKQLSKIFQVKDLDCRPCSKLGYSKCPLGHFNCMMKMPAKSIANWVCGMYAEL